MYFHVQRFINEIEQDEPDPAAANALQEGLGGISPGMVNGVLGGLAIGGLLEGLGDLGDFGDFLD